MPSFDVVSEANAVEVKNSVDQANKEISTRFDFKGTDARIDQKERELTAFADSDFQLDQVRDVLTGKLTKRIVVVRFLDLGKIEKIGGDKVKKIFRLKYGFGLVCCAAQASDIGVVGLFPGIAVLVVDGAAPKTYSAGSTVADGGKLIAVGTSSATIEIGGKRQNFPIGEHFSRSASSGPAATSLRADGQGHFVTQGQINGGTVTMLVDTGASQVALSSAEAMRLGIDYRKGKRGYSQTANGVVAVYRVNLDSVKVGDITLNQVEASVHEISLPIVLLGMSFLIHTEMRREGELLTLVKRY